MCKKQEQEKEYYLLISGKVGFVDYYEINKWSLNEHLNKKRELIVPDYINQISKSPGFKERYEREMNRLVKRGYTKSGAKELVREDIHTRVCKATKAETITDIFLRKLNIPFKDVTKEEDQNKKLDKKLYSIKGEIIPLQVKATDFSKSNGPRNYGLYSGTLKNRIQKELKIQEHHFKRRAIYFIFEIEDMNEKGPKINRVAIKDGKNFFGVLFDRKFSDLGENEEEEFYEEIRQVLKSLNVNVSENILNN